jgi:hypothetical protein
VKGVFVKWDDDKDGYITQDNFMDFYHTACVERPHVVWSNLAAHHIRNDLKRISDVEQEEIDTTILPRRLLSADPSVFNILFRLLDESQEIAADVWDILQRIPTSPQLLESIISLEGVRESKPPNWDALLSAKSSYRLLYSLSVIEHLMEDEVSHAAKPTESTTQLEETLVENAESLMNKKTGAWRADFILYGGIEHLLLIFKQIKQSTSIAKMNVFDKNIISFILRVLRNYLVAALGDTIPKLYRINQAVRIFFISLDVVAESLLGVRSADLLQGPTVTDADKSRAFLLSKLEETREHNSLVERLRGSLGEKILAALDLGAFLEEVKWRNYFEKNKRYLLLSASPPPLHSIFLNI